MSDIGKVLIYTKQERERGNFFHALSTFYEDAVCVCVVTKRIFKQTETNGKHIKSKTTLPQHMSIAERPLDLGRIPSANSAVWFPSPRCT